MHQFLQSIGYSARMFNNEAIDKLLKKKEKQFMKEARRYASYDGTMLLEIRNYVNEDMGICQTGYLNGLGRFVRLTYYPFFCPKTEPIEGITSSYITKDGVTYYIISTTLIPGMRLSIHSDNPYEHTMRTGNNLFEQKTKMIVTGLSDDGVILLPVRDEKMMEKNWSGYNYDVAALVEPDENMVLNVENIQQATMESLAKLAEIDKRLDDEDLYSIVSTLCMPHVYESEMYFIIGIIEEVKTVENNDTGETVYELKILVNDATFYVAVNEDNLAGEPAVGCRFKGCVWLTAHICF